jgi:septum site-determining protein MinC
MNSLIQIKGIREGLLVNVSEGEWPELMKAILDHLDHQKDFLHGAKLFIDVGNQILNAVELSRLRDGVSERGITLWGVLSNSPKTETTAQLLGLATRISKPSRQTQFRDQASPDTTIQEGETAVLVRRTLRSGYRLKHSGNVVVIGDINPGAEIIAGGSIVVWGHLRGVVHAGADGDETAKVCALDLSPSQIRIANQMIFNPTQTWKDSARNSSSSEWPCCRRSLEPR